ncbi:MAG: peptidase, partial [Enterovirga sp.]|nr:peptidase [Enterovirga sp.]
MMVMALAQHAAAQEKRVALVVGIGAYESVPRLPNSVRDANAIADMFRTAGFEVVTARTDVRNLDFKRAIREFEDTAATADIAVVFYAGHGIEVASQNYLIPSDAKLVNERDVEDEAIPLERLMAALEPAKRLRLIILDACRDNPFASKMRRRVVSRGVSPGLGRVEPTMTDTLVAYAAKEKSVASDGEGDHSPFTTALLKNLTEPGLDIRLAFGRVRDEVLKATNRQQEPFVYGSLGGGTVALVRAPDRPALAPSGLAAFDQSKADYEIVERVGKREAWQVYLNTHKAGIYAELARVQLAKLDEAGRVNDVARAVPSSPQIVPAPVETPAKPSRDEQRAWDRVRRATDPAAVRAFIERYPSSLLVPDAEDRLEELARLERERQEAARAQREAAQARAEEDKRRKAAEAEQKRLEQEAALQRRAEERAKAAEAERLRAEAIAAARQREVEERARQAELAARKREEEQQARAEALAAQRQAAEERAKAAEAARQHAAREAAEAASAARQGGAEQQDKAAETAARQKEAEARAQAAEAQRLAAERDAESRRRETEQNAKRLAEEKQKADAERRKVEQATQTTEKVQAQREAAEHRRKAAEAARV